MSSQRRQFTDRSNRPSRGVVIVAVMLAVTLASTAVIAVLLRADSQVSRAISLSRHARSRAAAWSGVRATLAELAQQREKLLQGATPQVTGSWMLMGSKQGGEQGIAPLAVRLLDLGPGEASLLQAEAAKVNINSAGVEGIGAQAPLMALEGQRLFDARQGAGFSSIPQAASSIGIDEGRVYGQVLSPESAWNDGGANSRRGQESGVDAGAGASAADAESAGTRPGSPLALLDVFTVFSFDPNLQVGIGADAAQYAGKARINLGMGWSDDLAGPIAERFGADAVGTTRQLMESGAKFKSMGDVVGIMRQLGVPLRQWGSLLDAFTTSPDPFIAGRIDLLRADEAVLATVPGIDAAAASKIVSVRDRIDASARRELTWPVMEGILTQEQFQLAVDGLTNRTLQWRIIVEAGRVMGGSQGGESSDLSDRIVYEAVLDLAGPQPRVAYLRDLTAMEAMRTVRKGIEGASGDEPPTGETTDNASSTAGLDGLGTTASELDIDAGLEMDAMMMDSDLSFASETAQAPAEAMDAEPVSAGGRPVPQARGVDRRTGRWNTAKPEGGRP
ncbi:MAG: hypothetical protein IT435_03045 [Phycisphaerales bacterium]|nr:hypothetical protein [Phycisphaerales bacterium]